MGLSGRQVHEWHPAHSTLARRKAATGSNS